MTNVRSELIQTKVTDDLKQQVKKLAEKQERTISKITYLALKDYVDRHSQTLQA